MYIRNNKMGYSLLEISLALIIISILAGSSIYMFSNSIKLTRYADTKNKIIEIKQSLNKFFKQNNRLPCPAQLNIPESNANFGLPIYSTGSGSDTGCDTTVPANVSASSDAHAANTPAGTYSVSASGNWVRIGALPIKALGLPNDMTYDDFGNKFTYMVTEKATTANTNGVDGVIVVNDGITPTIISSSAVFAVISHGNDAKGSYSKDNLFTSCGSVGRDIENCDFTNATVTDTQFNDLNYSSSSWYDDIIGWETKNEIINLQVVNPTLLLPNKNGNAKRCGYAFFVDGGTFNPTFGISATTFRVLAIGGGGGGAGAGAGGGGGGGSGKIDVATVNFSGNSTITIGSGGNGGAYTASGTAGGTTYLTNATSAGVPVLTSGASTATGGGAGALGNPGAGGAGGVSGKGGSGGGANPADQTGFSISTGGTIVSDGTDTVTFKCASFAMPTVTATVNSGGHGGNGISSPQAPKLGNMKAGYSNRIGGGVSRDRASVLGGGGAGGDGPCGSGWGKGGSGGAGGSGGDSDNATSDGGGGGGGYGGGGGGGATNRGGSGGGYGGNQGACANDFYEMLQKNANGSGTGGLGQGGNGGAGYGSGGGGAGITNSGGGGGGNGLVYIEWDK